MSNTRLPRIVFGGDRQIAVDVLSFLREQGVKPLGLLLAERDTASHADALLALCPHLSPEFVWRGRSFRSAQVGEHLRHLELDYIICIHFPLIVPWEVLRIPRHGVLNLHPAYLPYNRGWHNSVWAILEKTPYGATLHFMNEKVDAGDIVHQMLLEVTPADTGDSLYKRALQLEVEVFKEAWPQLAAYAYTRCPQAGNGGTAHRRQELFTSSVQALDLEKYIRIGELIDRIRALTTNSLQEACYFVKDGRRYRVQLRITPEST